MCDVQTFAMITDMSAAVKGVVLKVIDCKHTAGLNYLCTLSLIQY